MCVKISTAFNFSYEVMINTSRFFAHFVVGLRVQLIFTLTYLMNP